MKVACRSNAGDTALAIEFRKCSAQLERSILTLLQRTTASTRWTPKGRLILSGGKCNHHKRRAYLWMEGIGGVAFTQSQTRRGVSRCWKRTTVSLSSRCCRHAPDACLRRGTWSARPPPLSLPESLHLSLRIATSGFLRVGCPCILFSALQPLWCLPACKSSNKTTLTRHFSQRGLSFIFGVDFCFHYMRKSIDWESWAIPEIAIFPPSMAPCHHPHRIKAGS